MSPERVSGFGVMSEALREHDCSPFLLPGRGEAKCPACGASGSLQFYVDGPGVGVRSAECDCARSEVLAALNLAEEDLRLPPPDAIPMLTGEQLLAMPSPACLIEGLLPDAGLSVLYGAPESFKSFVALDWACCLAAGVPWSRREVQPVWVVYVAAEGVHGVRDRYAAWLASRGLQSVERLRFVPEALNLLDAGTIDRARRPGFADANAASAASFASPRRRMITLTSTPQLRAASAYEISCEVTSKKISHFSSGVSCRPALRLPFSIITSSWFEAPTASQD